MRLDANQRRLAKERKHYLIQLQIDGQHCDPPQSTISYCGPAAPERAEEMLNMLKRWLEKGQA